MSQVKSLNSSSDHTSPPEDRGHKFAQAHQHRFERISLAPPWTSGIFRERPVAFWVTGRVELRRLHPSPSPSESRKYRRKWAVGHVTTVTRRSSRINRYPRYLSVLDSSRMYPFAAFCNPRTSYPTEVVSVYSTTLVHAEPSIPIGSLDRLSLQSIG